MLKEVANGPADTSSYQSEVVPVQNINQKLPTEESRAQAEEQRAVTRYGRRVKFNPKSKSHCCWWGLPVALATAAKMYDYYLK
ncbi:hypothetical protein HNY73_015634 [Argiope bruennichi]|uniref:Uncharacterized protein n=1 Tax=Argiope bruennichi TaxID=94029 RepID=A0A8T0ESV7_ARGBR|nr:hypothetical protein HNY73_015634 [Argiope bruennichi]